MTPSFSPPTAMDLPIEILHQIVLYLPRHMQHLLILLQPHPLGQIASYIYFSTLSLHFGVRGLHQWHIITKKDRQLGSNNPVLFEWHIRRSREILTSIIDGSNFATRVKKLKIYAPGLADSDNLKDQIDLLKLALLKMTRLRALECHGLLLPLRGTISSLSETIPHLQTLRLSDCINGSLSPPSNTQIDSRLTRLVLCQGWQEQLSTIHPLSDLTLLEMKKLHITSQSTATLTRYMTPAFTGGLTHLSLTTVSINNISSFEIALRYGVNLRSLRIKGFAQTPNSQHFRQYSQALPFLVEFGIYLSKTSRLNWHSWSDTDFFPSVCDFLRPKAAQLVHLELGAPDAKVDQDKLGFNGGRPCWDMLKPNATPFVGSGTTAELTPFPKLESLAMTLPTGKRAFSPKLIPKGVTRLSLSGYQILHHAEENIFENTGTTELGAHWPPKLHLVCMNIGHAGSLVYCDPPLAHMVGESIPTVRVIKIVNGHHKVRGFWSVLREAMEEGQHQAKPRVRCKKWDIREAMILRDEMLDRCECEDTWFEDY